VKKIVAAVVFVFLAFSAHASEPQRIISLKPNITEIIFALGAGDRLVGVTKYCDYPEGAKKIPRVADYVRPFTEKIIALSPDLIIGSEENSSRKSVEILRRMEFDVKLFPFTTVDEMMHSIEKIGVAVGKKKEAKSLVVSLREKLEKSKGGCSQDVRRRVLVAWGHRPLVVTGSKSFMGELLELIGAVNVAGGGSSKYPHWSAEKVIASDPEIIIDMSMGTDSSKNDLWDNFSTVTAVERGNIYKLDDSMLRAGPRLPLALGELVKTVCADH
jgi:iron complex transport system substrate-binding protein